MDTNLGHSRWLRIGDENGAGRLFDGHRREMIATEAEQIADGLSEAQKRALIDAVTCLDSIAGKGIYIEGYPDAADVLADLFDAFAPGWGGNDTYPAAFRAYIEEKSL